MRIAGTIVVQHIFTTVAECNDLASANAALFKAHANGESRSTGEHITATVVVIDVPGPTPEELARDALTRPQSTGEKSS